MPSSITICNDESSGMHEALSVVIITFNAEAQLPAVLAGCSFADEILVVDSGSNDRTQAIATAAGARVLERRFDGFGPQKRFAVEQATHDWILALDADEVLDAVAQAAIQKLNRSDPQQSWRLRRRTYIGRREIRYGHWHPDLVLRLFHRQQTTFTAERVHESVPPTPRVATLPGCLHHYSFTDLIDVFRLPYQRQKAARYRQQERQAGALRLLLRAGWAFGRSYLLKRGCLDGVAGVVVALSASLNAVVGLASASWDEPPSDPQSQ